MKRISSSVRVRPRCPSLTTSYGLSQSIRIFSCGLVTGQRCRSASPAISPATRPMPKTAATDRAGLWRTAPSALVVAIAHPVDRLVGVPAGGVGRMRDGR